MFRPINNGSEQLMQFDCLKLNNCLTLRSRQILHLSPSPSRSLREAVLDAEWQADQEEEDNDQEMHTESLLQRVFQLRNPFRADPGALYF